MARGLALAVLALAGLLCAAAVGYGAYVVSRGSVAVPVTRLQRVPPAQLTPARVRPNGSTRPAPPPPPATPAGEHEDD
jgi:hypothetical protein